MVLIFFRELATPKPQGILEGLWGEQLPPNTLLLENTGIWNFTTERQDLFFFIPYKIITPTIGWQIYWS